MINKPAAGFPASGISVLPAYDESMKWGEKQEQEFQRAKKDLIGKSGKEIALPILHNNCNSVE